MLYSVSVTPYIYSGPPRTKLTILQTVSKGWLYIWPQLDGLWLPLNVMSSNLSWSPHITLVCSKLALVASFVTYSNSPLHPLNQTVLFSCSPSFVLLFIVWDLHIKSDIENVENVQRFVQRICSKKWHSNYDRNLQIFNLFLLSICKVIYKIFVFSDL